MNKGKTLLFIEQSDVFGQGKAAKLKGYYNEIFRQNPDANVTPGQILKLALISGPEISRMRHTLITKRSN